MVTLDIEDASVKIMTVKGRRMETAATLPLEPGLVHDGVIIDPAIVGRRISELMAAHGIAERKVVVSISGIHSIYHVVNLPLLPKAMLGEAAKREMERLMAMPLTELYTSWQAISMSNIETTMCLIGLPRNTVDAMLATLRQAGLQSEAMDAKPLALARIADERDAIIINAQSYSFDIVVMVDGVAELLRSLSFPAGATSPGDKVDEVKEELERTVAFYNSSHKGGEITPNVAAFVTGELGDMLAGTLEYRVKPLPQLLSNTDSLITGEYAANIGLALRQTRGDFSPARVNINVTPEAYLPKPLPTIQIFSWAFIIIAIAVLFFFGISTLQQYRETMALQAQVHNAQTQAQVLQGTEAAIKKLQTQITEAKKASAAIKQPLDSAKAQRAKVNGNLSKVTSLLPGIIVVQTISYANDSITINGTSPDETTIVDYVRKLSDSGRFSQVLISNMIETTYNKWQFSLTLR